MGKTKTHHDIIEYYEIYRIEKQRYEIMRFPSFKVSAPFNLEKQNTILGLFKDDKLPSKCRCIHDKAMSRPYISEQQMFINEFT